MTSAVIAVESLDSLANIIIEIGQDHLLDKICFESMTTLSVDCLFKGIWPTRSTTIRLNLDTLKTRITQSNFHRGPAKLKRKKEKKKE